MSINLNLNIQKARRAIKKVTVDAQNLNSILERHFKGWMLRLRDSKGRFITETARNRILLAELEAKNKEVQEEIQITISQAALVDQIIKKEKQDVDRLKAYANQQFQEMEIGTSQALSALRRVATFSSYVFQFLGETTGQVLSLLAETITLTIQTAQYILQLDIATAFASPWRAAFTLATVGIRLALIGMLMLMTAQISVYRQQVSTQMNAAVGAFRIITI